MSGTQKAKSFFFRSLKKVLSKIHVNVKSVKVKSFYGSHFGFLVKHTRGKFYLPGIVGASSRLSPDLIYKAYYHPCDYEAWKRRTKALVLSKRMVPSKVDIPLRRALPAGLRHMGDRVNRYSESAYLAVHKRRPEAKAPQQRIVPVGRWGPATTKLLMEIENPLPDVPDTFYYDPDANLEYTIRNLQEKLQKYQNSTDKKAKRKIRSTTDKIRNCEEKLRKRNSASSPSLTPQVSLPRPPASCELPPPRRVNLNQLQRELSDWALEFPQEHPSQLWHPVHQVFCSHNRFNVRTYRKSLEAIVMNPISHISTLRGGLAYQLRIDQEKESRALRASGAPRIPQPPRFGVQPYPGM